MIRSRPTSLLLLLTLTLAACQPTPIPPPPPVPPPQAEMQPLPPISAEAQVWRPGHWHWDGQGFIWVRGEDPLLGTHSSNYVLGQWQPGPGGWVWHPFRWL